MGVFVFFELFTVDRDAVQVLEGGQEGDYVIYLFFF